MVGNVGTKMKLLKYKIKILNRYSRLGYLYIIITGSKPIILYT